MADSGGDGGHSPQAIPLMSGLTPLEVLEGGVSLPDGRRLGYVEWGRADGPVVVLCHPATRVVQPGWGAAEAAGVRIVLPDRPGLGSSTFQEGRSILGWPADIDALTSHLGVARFSVAGVSACTPYALACGLLLGHRVEVVGVIAGTVPANDDERRGIPALAIDDRDAALEAIEARLRAAGGPEAAGRRSAERPEPDGSLYRRPDVQAALAAASREARRQGTRGVAYDQLLGMLSWGFGLADLARPCLWWHGAADSVVPVERVEQATTGLSQHSVKVVAGVGHGICMTHVEAFLRELRSRADSQ